MKPRLASNGPDREVERAVLAHTFDGALRLLHPIVPCITEELWHKLPQSPDDLFLANASWPTDHTRTKRSFADEHWGGNKPHITEHLANPSALALNNPCALFELTRETVMAVRQIRSENDVAPKTPVSAMLVAPAALHRALGTMTDTVASMAQTRLQLVESVNDSVAAHALLSHGSELVIPLAGLIDLAKEAAKLQAQYDQLAKQLELLDGRLANEKFTAKAPAELVAAERAKADDWRAKCAQLRAKIRKLQA